MTAATASLSDQTDCRLDEIAHVRGTSVDRLFDDMVAETDGEARFRTHAQRGRGKAKQGLALLRKAAVDGSE